MDKDFVKTDDTAFAAFLMLHDYTALGAVDEGIIGPTGKPRYYIYLTHADEDVRSRILEHSSELRDKLNGIDFSYIQFFKHYRKLATLMHRPLNPEEFIR